MIQLSYSSLNIFRDCTRCFYNDRKLKITRPRGIMSSFPNGVDKLLKAKLEVYRGSLPPALQTPELDGFVLYAGSDLAKMRNWKSNPLKMTDSKGNVIVGAFDDLLFNPTTQEYAFLDYKTKGSEPDQAYCEKYYQMQLDIYTRFLEVGGRKVAPFGVFLYFWPVESQAGLIDFKSKPFFLTPKTEDAEIIFRQAIFCLESNIAPPSAPGCEYCAFIADRSPVLA